MKPLNPYVVDLATIGNAVQAITDAHSILTDPNKSLSEKASAGGAMLNSLNDLAGLSDHLMEGVGKYFAITGLLTSSASLKIEFTNMSNKSQEFINNPALNTADDYLGSVASYIGAFGSLIQNIGAITDNKRLVAFGVALQTYSSTWNALNKWAKSTDFNIFTWGESFAKDLLAGVRYLLTPPSNPNDPHRSDPNKTNTYRIVWIGDPLTLDLDGDGIETVAATSGVPFDHNADGIQTTSGWIKPDDGLLVRDINGNGTIDTGRELFGDSTLLTNGKTAANGFSALADLDSNKDGVVDASDAAFTELKVWQDANQDGISQTDELKTLAELGISSLAVSHTQSNTTLAGGTQTQTGSYTKADGSSATMADLNLTQDTFNTQYTDSIDVPEELQDLPDLPGMGRLRSLQEAASLSPALVTILRQYSAATTRNEQKALIDQLLLEWAKTDPLYSDAPIERLVSYASMVYDENSSNIIYLRRGESVSYGLYVPTYADTLTQNRTRIIDAIMGDRLTKALNEIVNHETTYINTTYEALSDAVYQSLLTQTRLKPYLDSVELHVTEYSVDLDFTALNTKLQEKIVANPANGITDLIELVRNGAMLTNSGWNGYLLLEETLRSAVPTPELQSVYDIFNVRQPGVAGGSTDDIMLGDTENRRIADGSGDNIILGGTGSEAIVTGNGNDVLLGGVGNDVISAGMGDDLLDGGEGDDILSGNQSGYYWYSHTNDNDTYLFGFGDGHDTITDYNWNAGNTDVIRFKTGVRPEDVHFQAAEANNADLKIVLGDGSDTIIVKNWFYGNSYQIEQFVFNDGTVLDNAWVNANLILLGTEENDTVSGSYQGETLKGFAGDDLLDGGWGNDILDGGTGDDLLQGGYGDDTYVWGPGSGRDVIIEQNYSVNNQDTITLTAGVTPDDLIIRRVGDDMVLTINGADEQLTVKSGFYDYSNSGRIEQIRFSDGTSWDVAAMQVRALLTTDGNDTIVGFKSDDIIDGKAGNDLLKGGSGNDTYLFGRGSGNDTITEEYDWSSTDTIQFTGDINPADLSYNIVGNDLLIAIKDTGESVRITNGAWYNNMIERFNFSDGTSLTWDDVKLLTSVPPSSESLVGTPDDDTLTGTDLNSTILGLEGNDILVGAGGNDIIEGGDGDDILSGNNSSDTLRGGSGDDTLQGGSGRDYLEGGLGSNSYLFEQGTGLDQIHARLADGSDDTILFAAGITVADLQVQLGNQRDWDIQPGDSGYGILVVGTGDDAFKIEIDGWSDISRSSIKRFVFSDGSELTLDQVIALNDGGITGYQYGSGQLTGSNADDSIYGDYSDDVIQARAGNDYVYANNGNDTVYGGSGDDNLSGGSGDDLLDASKGNDFLYGNSGSDILVGGKGDDSLNGGSGLDTYLFNRGDGNDYLETPWEGGAKTLSFGVDITLSDVSAFVNESGQLVLQVNNGIDGSLTMNWFDRSTMVANNQLPLQQVQFVDASGNVTIFNLEGLVQARLGALTNSDADHTTLLFENAGEYNTTFSAIPTGGDTAVAYAQTGDLSGMVTYTVSSAPSDGDDRIVGTQWGDAINGGNGNDLIYGLDGDDYLEGGAGKDRIDAGAGNDIIYGNSGDDLVMAGEGDDTIYAGPGNDIAYGGFGNDTYVFNAGDGKLTIEDNYLEVTGDGYGGYGGEVPMFAAFASSGDYGGDYGGYGGDVSTVTNVLQFGVGITLADLKFSTESGYLIIDIPTTGDQLRLAGYDSERSTLTRAVDVYRFVDGSEATQNDIVAMGMTTSGSEESDYLVGSAGNDTIIGGFGDDTLSGSYGGDYLDGGWGNDIYIFNRGDGSDTIVDVGAPGMENSIQFGYDISVDDIQVEIVDGNLVLHVGDNGDSLRILGFDPTLAGMPEPIGNIYFDDGTAMSLSELVSAKQGAAYQQGGAGNNIYTYNKGDGTVVIDDFQEETAENILLFGPGITSQDLLRNLRFEQPDQSASGRGSFMITLGDGDTVVLNGFNPEDVDNSPRSIDTFHFEDGTTLSFAEAVRYIFVVEGDDDGNYLTGTNVADRLYGYENDDQLDSGAGDDVLTGGTGNDYLEGGTGNDTYVFNLGDGTDTIIDASELDGENRISFGTGIIRDDVSHEINGSTLLISYGSNGDTITVENFSRDSSNGTPVIDTFEFSDGMILTLDQFLNQAPQVEAAIEDVQISEDMPFTLQLSDDLFSDADGDSLTWLATLENGDPLPSWLSFEPITRTFSGIPANGDIGDIRVMVAVVDPLGAFTSSSFTLTVENVNDAPTVLTSLAAQSAIEDQSFSYVIPSGTFRDIDVDDTLTLSATLADGSALPAWLAFDAATGTFSGTPANGDVGNLNLLITATDQSGATVSTGFALDIANINDAPVVVVPLTGQTATEDQNFSYVIPATTFKDIDAGDSLTLSATLADGSALPSWLSFDAATGTLTGTPGNDQVGTVQLLVTATDQSGAAASSSLQIDTANVNDAPVVPIKRVTLDEDWGLIYVELLDFTSDIDPTHDTLTVTGVGNAQHGTVTMDAWHNVLFQPTPDYNGPASFDYTVSDGQGGVTTGTVAITILPVNDAPIVTASIADQQATEDQPFSLAIPTNTFSDVDAGDRLVYTATLDNGDPLPSWLSFDVIANTISGTPTNDTVGALTVRITATDLSGATASTSFVVNVNNVNDAPVVVAPLTAQNATQDVAFTLQVTENVFNDIDAGDKLTYSVTQADGSILPSWLQFNATTGTLAGTPGNDQVGTLQLLITATDQSGASVSSGFSLTIANVNDAPILVSLLADQAVDEGQSFSYMIPANTFKDIDAGDTLTLSATLADGSALPSWLSFDPVTGLFNGTPGSGTAGGLNITVTATDRSGASVADTFALTINTTDVPIYGTPCADKISALPKGSTIYGLGGCDILYGNVGKDKMYGGDGEDSIYGWDGDDYIDGGAGSDILVGDVGNDAIHGGDGLDNLFGDDGNDILYGEANHDYLEGNAGDDTLYGGDGHDELLGGAGADGMFGGTGDDLYVVDNASDTVVELTNEGYDTVNSSISYTLGENVEDLLLTGSSAIDGSGNNLNNTLTGNAAANILLGASGNDYIYGKAGDDTLDGGTGADGMCGGTGNDTYFVDNNNDYVQESSGQGTDTVNSSISYTLTSNVENLNLTGGAAINGTGNTLNNILTGNVANNALNGKVGNDTLDGGAGNDTLTGGTGNDTFILGRGYGSDTIVENDSTVGNSDTAQFLSGIAADQLWFQHAGSNLEVSVIGTSDKYTIQNWYSGSQYHVEQFKTADGKTLADSNVEALVSAMASFAAPGAGQTTLPQNYQTALAPVIAANWH